MVLKGVDSLQFAATRVLKGAELVFLLIFLHIEDSERSESTIFDIKACLMM